MSFKFEISNTDIRTLRTIRYWVPPKLVMEVLECVSVLYGNTDHEYPWRTILNMFSQENLYSELAAISKETLLERRELIKGKTFNEDEVRKKSDAIVPFARWVNQVQAL